MNVVVAGTLDTAEDVEAAVDFDTSTMQLRVLEPNMTAHPGIRLLLMEHYRLLNSIFIHYCGTAKPGHIFGMNYDEFAHFLHFVKAYHAKTDVNVMREIFTEAASSHMPTGKGLSPNSPALTLLSRARFVYAIMREATKMEDQTGASSDVVDQVEDLLMNHVQPSWDNLLRCVCCLRSNSNQLLNHRLPTVR